MIKINTQYKSFVTSSGINEKIYELLGEKNCILRGYEVSVVGNNVFVGIGKCSVKGATLENDETIEVTPTQELLKQSKLRVVIRYVHNLGQVTLDVLGESARLDDNCLVIAELTVKDGSIDREVIQTKPAHIGSEFIKNILGEDGKINKDLLPNDIASQLEISIAENTVVLDKDDVSVVDIGIKNYNKQRGDKLFVIHQGFKLTENSEYVISDDSRQIVRVSSSKLKWGNEDEFDFIVVSNAKQELGKSYALEHHTHTGDDVLVGGRTITTIIEEQENKIKTAQQELEGIRDNICNGFTNNIFIEDFSTLEDVIVKGGVYDQNEKKIYV